MLRSVTLLGSSSGRNAGDAALMSGIMDSVDAACGSRLLYEIPTISPSFVRNNYRNRVKPIGILPWNLSVKMLGLPTYRSVMRTDLSLIFDAILFDRSLYNPLFNFLSTLWLILPAAKRRGKILGCYNVGLGPVTTPAGRKMLKELLEIMDFVTVRDEGSMAILRELGVENPMVKMTADAALTVSHSGEERGRELIRGLGLDPDGEILAVNVNRYMDTWAGTGRAPIKRADFVQTYAAALNRVAEQASVPLLFVATQHHDVEITGEVMEAVDGRVRKVVITNTDYSHYDIQSVLASVSMLFAMRLHAIILATSSCTPVVGVAYQPKVGFYMERLGLAEHTVEFTEFTADHLADRVLRAWDGRGRIRTHLESVVPALKEQATEAAGIVASLHSGGPLGPAAMGP